LSQHKREELAEKVDTVVIHIHGGGFISMSSHSHQTYTTKWAESLPNTAIFSIDYRLAPESRFPSQIDDCWQAYVWIVNHAKTSLGIDPKRVVLVGDSAGGSLILALTLMAIERGFKVPDAVLPIYPTSIIKVDAFWPSMLAAIDDPILSTNFIMLAMNAYKPKDQEQKELGKANVYLSPTLVATDEQLKYFPPTHIVIAGMDPLRDDGLMLADRLLGAGVDTKVTEMEMMPHGFLNYKIPLN
jgi:hormone-sensitive lipase